MRNKSTSQKQAVITLIQNKIGMLDSLKTGDQYTTFESRSKSCILAYKAIAYGVRKVIPDLIHPDQTTYVKSRYIGGSVRVIEDILGHAKQENLNGILFTVDINPNRTGFFDMFRFGMLPPPPPPPPIIFLVWGPIATKFCTGIDNQSISSNMEKNA